VRVARRFLHAHDLVVDLRVPAGKERAAVDHHVDLVGALVDDPGDLLELQLDRDCPDGNDVATEATLTLEPSTRATAAGTRFG